ncbi:MAG: arsenic resistance N-acetyltransferase ArsN2 [Burkholderiaceae bacterium]
MKTIARLETREELAALKALLSAAHLPVSDITLPSSQTFFGIRDQTDLVASIGLELYGQDALLRSLAVLPSYRNQGLARTLLHHAEDHAAQQDLTALYLLTLNAQDFFFRHGYMRLAREDAPAPIAASAQFSGLCPASAVFLYKSIAH